MASEDKKTKTSPAPENAAAMKKEATAKKKDEGQPNDKSTSDVGLSKSEGGEKAADSPSGYSRGEGQKPVSKAIGITGTRFTRTRKRRSGNSINGTGIAVSSCVATRISRSLMVTS